MSQSSPGGAIPAARDLRLALDQLSEACIAADLDGMLAAEAGLAVALSHFHPPLSAPADLGALTMEIEALRQAFERAARLGASFEDVLRVSAGVLAPTAFYDRAGRERTAASLEPALEARG